MKYIYNDKIKVPVDQKFIAEQQQSDDEFEAARIKYPERFKETTLNNDVKLQLYQKDLESKNWLINVPEKMTDNLIDWFHTNQIHSRDESLIGTTVLKFQPLGAIQKKKQT